MSSKQNAEQNNSLKKRVLNGTLWLFLEKGGISIFEFAVAWVLARFFLTPADYSVVGLVTIFTSFAGLFIQGSFNNALIQKEGADEKDKSSVFWLSLLLGVFCYLVLFFAAPLVSKLYGKSELTLILRILSLSLIFDSLCVVQIAVLTKEMKFRKIFIKTLVSVLVSSTLAITSAALGFGYWTIVIQTLSVSVVSCIVMWIVSSWHPKFIFSGERIKALFGFGSSMLLSNVINNVYSNALPAVMEKFYSANSLGYYNKAKTVPVKLGDVINGTITGIVFPSLSSIQNDKKRMKELTRRFIVTACFVTFAVMGGLIAVAEPMIKFIYTEKWAGSIVFMQFICLSYAFTPLNSANLQAIKALGKSKTYLVLEIIKNVLGFVLLIAAMWFTRKMPNALYIVLAVEAFTSMLCVFINAFPCKKLMDYGFGEQVKDVLPSLLLAIFMSAVVYCVKFLGLSSGLTLLIQVPLGAIIYAGLAWLFKFECFRYVLEIIKGFLHKKKGSGENND